MKKIKAESLQQLPVPISIHFVFFWPSAGNNCY